MKSRFPAEPLYPMEPVTCLKAFDSEQHQYQVKWDGVRIMVFYDGGKVTIRNRRLKSRTLQYPELKIISDLISFPVILDGEVIALKNGTPSFPQVMRRDRIQSAETAQLMVSQIPIAYMVFDLLYYQDQSLLQLPWYQRQEILRNILPSQGPFHLVENFSQGIVLFEEICRLGLEGIVAKATDSVYLTGGKSRHWQKIKNRPRITCLIGGYTMRGPTINSLLMGLLQEENLLFIGRVGSGLTDEEWTRLTRILSAEQRRSPPFINSPRIKGVFWVEPHYSMLIEYGDWTEESRLRSPVIKELSLLR
ncbi:MAG: DNA ligase [Syntrophomonadaceae bacterium]|nr:DNA ligase [Syntrophomonadaceae bacterium]